MNKLQNYRESKKYYRLHTPSLNPHDWYVGKQVNSPYKDYVWGPFEDGSNKIVEQTVSLMRIRNLEKSLGIELVGG